MILIDIDKPRHLNFDMNALSDADQVLDHKLTDILLRGKILLNTARVLLWAGLKHEDPGLTIEQTGILMDLWSKNGNTPVQMAEKIIEGLKDSGYFDMVAVDEPKNLKGRRGGTKQ